VVRPRNRGLSGDDRHAAGLTTCLSAAGCSRASLTRGRKLVRTEAAGPSLFTGSLLWGMAMDGFHRTGTTLAAHWSAWSASRSSCTPLGQAEHLSHTHPWGGTMREWNPRR
jgi:hypothetical protein